MEAARRLSFGSVAEQYDATRPSYPAALADDLVALADAGPERRVLEVGAGTGKATVMLAERGLRVMAIEPDPEMAAVARRNVARFGDAVAVVDSEFEGWDPQGERFQLLVSAQAWHWIDPEVRYPRARAALAQGGLLAAVWNLADWPRCELREAVDEAYRGIEFPVHPGPMLPRGERPDVREDWAREVDAAGGFGEAEVREYEWAHAYGTQEYLALLGTHSDHLLLPPAERSRLLEAVGAAIDRHGGTLVMPYVTRACLARAL